MNSKPYFKMAADTGDDEKIGQLLEASAEDGCAAAGLFFLSIGAAYPYGILPASPRAYRAKVAAAAMLSEAVIEKALGHQERLGLVHRYHDGDQDCIYIRNYHRYQDVAWSRVRQCDFRLPECWVTPEELEDFAGADNLAKCNKQWGEYGVMGLQQPTSVAKGQVPPPSPSATPVLGALGEHSGSNSSSSKQYSVNVNGGSEEIEEVKPAQPPWSQFQQTLQALWPGGCPEQFRSQVRREFDVTDPDIACAAARKTVRTFERKRDYKWPQVLEYVCSVMSGQQAKFVLTGENPADAVAKREADKRATLRKIDEDNAREFAAQEVRR